MISNKFFTVVLLALPVCASEIIKGVCANCMKCALCITLQPSHDERPLFSKADVQTVGKTVF